MCGISGFYKSALLNESHINIIAKTLSHRGPDFTGFYSDENVCVAHNRLSIIDLSENGNQPFFSQNGRYIMLFNGEVYNYKELAKELNITTQTSCDTEVVLEAFSLLGDAFIEKLNGMFAIVIYDKENGTMKLWRDRFGIKPLYYYWNGKDFAFASELKALYKLPFLKEIDEEALQDYLFLEYIPQPKTILQHFHKLGNGQRLDFKKENITLSTYYNILDKVKVKPYSEKKALEEFSNLFEQSLQYRLIADVPVGAFLSGGTDSSAVCAGLSNLTNNLSSFNISFDNKQYDESAYAKEVASSLQLNHHQSNLGSDEMLSSLDAVLSQFDEPFAVSSVFPTYKVCEIARSKVKVALSGDGGDELFMGYGHYNWYNRLKYFDSFAGNKIRHGSAALFRHLPSRYARLANLVAYDSLSKDWPHVWSQDQYMFTEKEINRLTSQSYSNKSLRKSWQDINKATDDPLLRISLFDLKHYLADDLLYKVDIASMAHGLEVRLPFLDHHLVESVVNLPTNLKIKQGEQKYLLKKYLEKSLPNDLIYRKKWGFGAPIDQWMKKDLKPFMHNYMDPTRIKNSGLINPDFANKLVNDFLKGNHFLYKRIWALMILEIWKEKFM